jgi:flagellar assembly factor FliW
MSIDDSETIVVPSVLMGPVTVRQADLFRFPVGLPGFESCRSFALVPSGRDHLWWLQSAERADLVFLVADPFHFFPGFQVDLQPTELAALGASPESTLMVLGIVTLPRTEHEAATANLRAPLFLDVERREGRQVVLTDERYHVAMPFDLG